MRTRVFTGIVLLAIAQSAHADSGFKKQGILRIDGREVATFELTPSVDTAEVKPPGTILSLYCGEVKELLGTTVCEAEVNGSNGQKYITLSALLKPTIYVRSTVRLPSTHESKRILTGYGVDPGSSYRDYPIEKLYELELTD